jgi:hypothetical protein
MSAKKNATQQPAMALLTSVAAIDKAITAIHKTGQQLQLDMHTVACSVLKHLGKNGDVRYVLKLINAMPEMSRKNGLMAWFEHFGPVTFTEDKGVVLATHVKDKKTLLGDAMAKPFWKFKANEGAPYEPIDMQAWAAQQIKKLEKDAKETKRDHTHLIMALKGYKPATFVQSLEDTL